MQRMLILQSRTTDKKSLRANLENKSDQEINDLLASRSIYVNFTHTNASEKQPQVRH